MFSDDPEDEIGADEQAELNGWAEIRPISITFFYSSEFFTGKLPVND